MSSSHATFPSLCKPTLLTPHITRQDHVHIKLYLYLITAAFWYVLQKAFRPETQQYQPDGKAQVTGRSWCQESKYKNELTHCKFVAHTHMQDILVSVCLRFSAMVF